MDKILAEVLVSVRRAKTNWLAHKEIEQHQMNLKKLRYDCALSAGFDKQQAFILAREIPT
jgi:hypothetical protein